MADGIPPKKCNVLRISKKKNPIIHNYTLHGHILETEESSKYLGVTIHHKLSWNEHINNVCKKGNQSIGFLRRNLQIRQKNIKENAYKALVRPQVEYASVVWDPYTKENKNKLEMVQRRAARYVCNDYSRESSVSAMIEELGWRSLEQRRADGRLILFYKIVHGLVAVNLSSQLIPVTRLTRHLHPMAFLLPSESKEYIQMSFLPRTIAQWNSLPTSVATTATLDSFKSGVCTLTH